MADLKKKISEAFQWSVFYQVVSLILSKAVIIYLAFHITPKELGRLGIALIVYGGLNLLGRTALGETRIQSDDHDHREIDDVVFTINLIRSPLICGVLYGLGMLLNSRFDTTFDDLIILLMVSTFISSFRSPRMYLLAKHLHMKKSVQLELFSKMTGGVVAAVLAVLTKNVTAVMYGMIAGSLVRVVMSQIYTPYSYRLSVGFSKLKGVVSFALWINFERIISFMSRNVEKIVLAFALSLEQLGIYSLAQILALKISPLINAVNKNTSFPVLARLKREGQMSVAVIKKFLMLNFTLIYLWFVVVVMAIPFAVSFLEPKWKAAMIPAILICAASIFEVLSTFISFGVFKGMGKAKLAAWQSFFGAICLLVLSLLFGRLWGVTGVAAAVLLTSAAIFPFIMSHLNRAFEHVMRRVDLLMMVLVGSSVIIPIMHPEMTWVFMLIHLIILVSLFKQIRLMNKLQT